MSVLIESTKSHVRSLQSIHDNTDALNGRRKHILEKVPNSGDYATFGKDYLKIKDLAYLTAATGDEFALLTGKNDDILFHGEKYRCIFEPELSELLKRHKYELYAHSHPDEDNPVPSIADRNTLLLIGQKQSMIISAKTMRITSFTGNQCLDYLL